MTEEPIDGTDDPIDHTGEPIDDAGDEATVADATNEPTPDGGVQADEAADGGAMVVDEDAHADAHADDHEHGLPPVSNVWRWLVTTNHKDIGILYIVTSLFFLVFGGVLALLIRAQMWSPRAPGEGIMTAFSYNQAVSAHGLLMVFFFLSPFAFGFANYVVPLQLGAKDLAFPRLNALSYWLYLFSGFLFGASFIQGGTLAGGWTMYAPLSVPTFMPNVGATTAVLGMILFTASVTVSGVNFLTTMHRMRADGLSLRSMPLFSWSILLTVWMMLFAFAALLAALMILASDRVLGTTYFAATSPGGALLWAHLFWFFGHPEVYIVFFPALGVMAETFQTFTGRRLVGRKWFIAAMLLVALQSFIVWMHHMFLTAINLEIKTLFMATTIGISLPFDLMVFALIYTMVKGRVRFTTPFLFSFGALLLFIIGGITGVFLGAVVLDYEFRGTYWVVAHFHYVMVGGVTALIGGLYYWFPKMAGKMYDEFLGKLHFVMFFVGFNLLYFPMFIVWETPRRVFQYDPAFTTWHRVATIGGFLLAASFAVMFYNLAKSMIHGEDAPDNPWAYSTTAEWAVPSPPPLENFPGVPSYSSGSLSFLDPRPSASTEGGGTPAAEATDGGAMVVDEGALPVEDEEHADHASIWPFMIALSGFVVFIGLAGFQTGGIYHGILGLGGVLTVFSFVGLGLEPFHAPEPEFAHQWPFANIENTKLGLWFFLASDVVLFGAFIGSYLFIRVSAGWVEWHPVPHNSIPGLINTYLLLTSSFAVVLALVSANRGSRRGVVASLVTTLLLGIGFLVNKAIEWQELFHEGLTLSSSVRTSTFYLTTGLHAAHVIVGLLIISWMIVRAWRGAYTGNGKPVEYFGLYWHFVDIVWLFLFPLFYII